VKTPFDVFVGVVAVDGKLGIAGEKLRTLLPADCPPALKDAIRQHKPALLELLRLEFLVVHSDVLNAVVFWAPDEATKQALIDAGADPGIIYTPDELDTILDRRLTPGELKLLHTTKQRFSGTIADEQGT
jgi:hypothetical protein